MKELGRMAISQIKKIYSINEQTYNKIAKLAEKKKTIDAELESLEREVEAMEQRVKDLTGGYTSKDLVSTTVTPVFNADGTPKLDKQGHPVRYKKYVFNAPTEDITPTPVEPVDIEPENLNNI